MRKCIEKCRIGLANQWWAILLKSESYSLTITNLLLNFFDLQWSDISAVPRLDVKSMLVRRFGSQATSLAITHGPNLSQPQHVIFHGAFFVPGKWSRRRTKVQKQTEKNNCAEVTNLRCRNGQARPGRHRSNHRPGSSTGSRALPHQTCPCDLGQADHAIGEGSSKHPLAPNSVV